MLEATGREITAKYDMEEYAYILINLLMILADNAKSLKPVLKYYIYQLFHQLIHVYRSHPKVKADNIILVTSSQP